MRTRLVALLPAAAAVASVSVLLLAASAGVVSFFDADQFADANALRKIHFTQTVSSSADPSISGAGSHHIAFILSPNQGTIYDGSMTFASGAPVSVLVLHAMTPEDARNAEDAGLPMWTVDNRTKYAASVIGPERGAGSLEFTGAAVALYSGKAEFAATVSVDAWVRGEPTPVVMQTIEVDASAGEPALLLSRSSVPAVIPMHEGMHEGRPLMYIITDSGDAGYASELSGAQGWRVEHAPALNSSIPGASLQQVYVFRNGVDGDGLYGYQPEVFSSTPDDPAYSALSTVVEVTWKPGQRTSVLEGVDDILREAEAGRVSLAEPDEAVVANMQQIVWPKGEFDDGKSQQAAVREDAEFSRDMPYGGGQITDIDMENMTVTFVAHRAWGPDGKTVYHIIAGATPQRPADVLGAGFAPAYAGLVDHTAAADFYIFENGIAGPGSLGFQPGIFGAAPGDGSYTPIWRVHTVQWNDPESDAAVLENISDIESFRDADALTAGIARPTNSYYVINSPIVDPFQ